MTGRPSRIDRATGELCLDARGARMVGAALDLALRNAPEGYRRRASWDDAARLREQCRLVAESAAAGTPRASGRPGVPESRLLGTGQAAELLGVTERAVTKRIKAGTLPARQVSGVWVIAELDVRQAGNGRKQ